MISIIIWIIKLRISLGLVQKVLRKLLLLVIIIIKIIIIIIIIIITNYYYYYPISKRINQIPPHPNIKTTYHKNHDKANPPPTTLTYKYPSCSNLLIHYIYNKARKNPPILSLINYKYLFHFYYRNWRFIIWVLIGIFDFYFLGED